MPPGEKFRDTFLLPLINVEDLSGGKSLPVFIHARARNDPTLFAINDCRMATLGISTQAATHELLKDGTHHRVCISGPQFGKLLITFDEASNMAFVDPEIVFLILEIQDRTLQFLVKCSRRIMHDITEDGILGDAFPIQEPLPQILWHDVESVTITILSLTEMTLLGPTNDGF